MRELFTETVLAFSPEERQAWKEADATAKRRMIPAFHDLHPMIVNQPAYHFGEFYVLNHLHRTEGWLGYRFYVLAFLEDLKNPRFKAGGDQIRRTFPAAKLAAYVESRGPGRSDAGDPDLFLYKPTGEAMFLEIKVGADKIDKLGTQLQTLAQIRKHLGCRAEIVHLIEHGRRYQPKTYWVEMSPSGVIPTSHGSL